jgi:hypothetical protein
MAELDLGQLLRLRGMIESAATSVTADGDGAPALTESYARLRGLARDFVEAPDLNIDEFDPAFPEMDVVEFAEHEHPRRLMARNTTYAPQAKRAQALLGQLGGWVSGLIDEITLEQRLRFEAQERVKQERRQPPGFRPDS